MKLKFFLRLFAICIGIYACSSSVGKSKANSNNSGDVNKIVFVTQNTVISLPNQSNYGYAVIINPEPTAITGIKYNISKPIGSGSNVTLDPTSAALCSTIAPKSTCTLRLVVPAGAIAGSFMLSADNQSNGNLQLQNSVTVGVTQAQYSSSSTNIVNAYFYPKVIEGTEYVVITGVVASPLTTQFNMVTLIDGNGNELPDQQIVSGNLGVGLTNLSQGATFTILLPVPSIVSNQTFQLKMSEVSADGAVSNEMVDPAVYNIGVEANQGLVNPLPAFINLTAANPSQVVTIYNNGNAAAQLQSLVANNQNLKVTFNSDSLAPGDTTTATVSLVESTGVAASSGLTLNWTSGIYSTSDVIVVDQTINPSPSPIPVPLAGLKVIVSPTTLVANTATGVVAGAITFTNTGNTPEQIGSLDFSANGFKIAQSDAKNIIACTIANGRISNILGTSSSNNSCTVKLIYTNNQYLPKTAGYINVAYTYNNGQSASSPVSALFNYEVHQAGAILKITPKVQFFGNILNNSESSSSVYNFKLYNSGQVIATGISMPPSFSGSNSKLFSNKAATITGSTCGTSLANGESCVFGLQFGPTPTSDFPTGTNESAHVIINYIKYLNIAVSESSLLTGNIVSSKGANINISGPVASGFYGGPGSISSNAYLVESSTPAMLTYTVTNTGGQANSFYIATSTLPLGWMILGNSDSNACGTQQSPKQLNGGNSNNYCTVTFLINSPNLGANNFNQNVMTAYWKDELNPNGTSQMANFQITYVNVYAPPVVNFWAMTIWGTSQSNIGQLPSTGGIPIYAQLTGGYAMPDQVFTLNTNQPLIYISNSNASTNITQVRLSGNNSFAVNEIFESNLGFVNVPNSELTITKASANTSNFYPPAMTYSATSVNSQWRVVGTPTTNDAVFISVDPSGNLYYTNQSLQIFMNNNINNPTSWAQASISLPNTFTGLITSFAAIAESNGKQCFSLGYYSSGSAAYSYCQGQQPINTSYSSQQNVSLVRYNPLGLFESTTTNQGTNILNPYGYFAIGSDFFAFQGVLYNFVIPITQINDYPVFSDMVATPNTLYVVTTTSALDYWTLFTCNYVSSSSQITCQTTLQHSYYNPASITADPTGNNIYVAANNMGIFIYDAALDPPYQIPLPTQITNQNATNSCWAGSAYINYCIQTQVRYDSYHNLLMAFYNYPENSFYSLVGYSPDGKNEYKMPELPEPPFIFWDYAQIKWLLSSNSFMDSTYIAIDNVNGIIYYIGQSGTIYSLQF